MDIPPIKTDEDHSAALREIEALWGAEEGTPEGDRLNLLTNLVEAFEERRWAAVQSLIELGGSDPEAVAGRRRRSD
jgi:antitoxin component HigA of HigAB toxin-antitoxin module